MAEKCGVILYVAAIILTAPLYADINILTNPGFETGTTTGWAVRAGGSIGVSTTTVRTGTYSGRAYNRTQSYQGIKQSILGLISNGQTCTISGYVRISTASDTVKLTVEKQEAGVTSYTQIQSKTCNNTTWTYLSGSYTLNATGDVTVLDIYFEGPASGVTLYVDDAAVMAPEPVGLINPSIRYQNMEGFGAAGAWYGGWLTAHPQRTALYNLLFRDLGLDIYRIRNTYQIDSGSMNTDDEIITAAQASLGRPLKIMISSWSPPESLKSEGSTVGGTLAKDGSGNYRYTDFAQWWLDSLNAYAALGITAEYINMQNEPDYLDTWDTCKFSATETTDYAGYNLAFAALANLAGSMPGSPKLLAPEAVGFNASKVFIDALLDKTPVYAYAHHLYGDGNGGSPDGYISGMASFAAQYNDKPRMQTEYSYSGDTGVFDPAAINLALLMHNALTSESVSAYLYWDLFWGTSGGLITLTNPWQANPTYTINPVYYAFKHYSAFIDSGWQRIAASSGNTNLRISAYISPDNKSITAVVINPSTSAQTMTLTAGSFPFTGGSIYRSSSTENAVLVGSFTPAQAMTIPAASITTITMSSIPTTCQHVQSQGYRMPADLNGDCVVNLSDLVLVVNQWLSTSPAAMSPNYSPDIVADNKINLADVTAMGLQWAECNTPGGAGCIEIW